MCSFSCSICAMLLMLPHAVSHVRWEVSSWISATDATPERGGASPERGGAIRIVDFLVVRIVGFLVIWVVDFLVIRMVGFLVVRIVPKLECFLRIWKVHLSP